MKYDYSYYLQVPFFAIPVRNTLKYGSNLYSNRDMFDKTSIVGNPEPENKIIALGVLDTKESYVEYRDALKQAQKQLDVLIKEVKDARKNQENDQETRSLCQSLAAIGSMYATRLLTLRATLKRMNKRRYENAVLQAAE